MKEHGYSVENTKCKDLYIDTSTIQNLEDETVTAFLNF